MAFFSKNFEIWAQKYPEEFLDLETIVRTWIFCTILLVGVILSLTFISTVHDFVQLEWVLPLSVYLFAPGIECIGIWLFHKGKISRSFTVFLSLIGSSIFQLTFALMIASSSWQGGAIQACLFILTSSYHAYVYRTSISAPYITIGTMLSLLVSFTVNHDLEHSIIILILFFESIACAFTIGSFAIDGDKKRAENERLKLAIQAQMLTDETTRADRLTEVIKEFSSWAHDMKNHLSNAEGCLMLLSPPADLPRLPHSEAEKDRLLNLIRQHHLDLRAGLDRTGKIIQALKTEEQQMEIFPLASTLEQIVNTIRCRFSNIEIICHLGKDLPKEIKLYGGKMTFHRIIENLIINACEGNGAQGASRIEIDAHVLSDEKVIRISISDNGPGFSENQLSKPIQTFQTTKETGTGLGLYSAERLVMAHCGKLTRANNLDGGATVSLILPVIAPSPDDFQENPTTFPQTPKTTTTDVVTSVSLIS